MPGYTLSRRKSYYKTLSISLFITIFPLLLLALTIFVFGTRRVEREASVQFERYFSRIAGDLDQQLQEIEIVGFQWGFNKTRILEYMNANFPEEFMVARSFEESLSRITTLSPLIRESYFWSLSDPTLILSDGESVRIDKDSVNLMVTNDFYNVLSDVRKIQWRFDSLFGPAGEQGDGILLLVKVPILIPSGKGILILEVDREKIIRLLLPENATAVHTEESAILLDRDMGVIASHGDCGEYFRNREEINGQIADRDSGVYVSDGSFFFYQKIKNKQWTAMSIIPMDRIADPVEDIARLIIYLVLFFLLAAVVLSYKASRTLYKPIERMVESITNDRDLSFSADDTEIDIFNKYLVTNSVERKNLNQELARHKGELRATFFNQLLNGDLSDMNDRGIRQRMKEIGMNMGDRKIGIIIVRLLEESYTKDHKAVNMLRFTAMSVLKNAQTLTAAHYIPCRDHMIAAIISFGDDVPSPKSRLWYRANEIKGLLASDLKLQTTVAMSDIIDDLGSAHDHYARTLKALSYSKLNWDDEIIDAVTSYESEMIQYPFAVEKELIHAFQMGRKNEVDGEIENFFSALSESTNTIYLARQQTWLLISNLMSAIMQTGFDPWELYKDRDLYEDLRQLDRIDYVEAWLKTEVIDVFINKIDALQDVEYRGIVSEVNEIIDREYSSPALSLSHCSELLDTYPQKICAAFKKIEETNFLAYLTEYRLRKAKDLLRHSELSVNMIAERVGYQPSYFNRVFKKKMGLTPGEYRKNTTIRLST